MKLKGIDCSKITHNYIIRYLFYRLNDSRKPITELGELLTYEALVKQYKVKVNEASVNINIVIKYYVIIINIYMPLYSFPKHFMIHSFSL